jgi:hypothetical protein
MTAAAPASSARRAYSSDIRVARADTPATTGTRPAVACTYRRSTRSRSSSRSLAASPMIPRIVSPCAPAPR